MGSCHRLGVPGKDSSAHLLGVLETDIPVRQKGSLGELVASSHTAGSWGRVDVPSTTPLAHHNPSWP